MAYTRSGDGKTPSGFFVHGPEGYIHPHARPLPATSGVRYVGPFVGVWIVTGHGMALCTPGTVAGDWLPAPRWITSAGGLVYRVGVSPGESLYFCAPGTWEEVTE